MPLLKRGFASRTVSYWHREPPATTLKRLHWPLLASASALAMLIGSFSQLFAQDRTWSVAVSIGYARLSFDQVDDDNAADVAGWNRLGIPLGDFASVKQSPFFTARASYRWNREFAFSLTAFYNSKEVTASYDGSDATLSLVRTVSSADVSLGVAYLPSLRLSFLEWYTQVDVGLTLARATADAHGTQTVKVAGMPTRIPLVETTSIFKRSKISVSAHLGADVLILPPVFLHVDGGYRFAPLGKIDGDVSRFGEHTRETSSIEFDYSGILVSVGIGIRL